MTNIFIAIFGVLIETKLTDFASVNISKLLFIDQIWFNVYLVSMIKQIFIENKKYFR